MSFNGGTIFTNRGRNLQAKAQSGVALVFTRIAVGDGNLGGQAIADLTGLISPIKSLDINKFKTMTGGKAVVGGKLSNQDITTGFYWRELGLFATDPDLGEILYCYGNAGSLAEYIPSPGGAEILEKQVDIVSIIGNAANVSAAIDDSLVYVTQEDFDDLAAVVATKETPAGAQAKADAVNNALTAHLADFTQQISYAVTAGSANAYTAATTPALPALVAGVAITVKFHAANTGAATLNWNGKGAKAIKKANGSDVSSGNLKLNGVYTLRYDGTSFILQGEGGEYGTAGAAQVLSGYTFGTENGLVSGTMANNPSQTATLQITGSAKPTKAVPAGYSPGGTITAELAAGLAVAILEGNTVGGVAGTAEGKLNPGLALRNFPTPLITYSTVAYVNNEGLWGFTYPDYNAILYNDNGVLLKTLLKDNIQILVNAIKDYLFTRNSSGGGNNLHIYNHDGVLIRTLPSSYMNKNVVNTKTNILYGATGNNVSIFNFTTGALLASYTIVPTATASLVFIVAVTGGVIVFYTMSGYAGLHATLVLDNGTAPKTNDSNMFSLLLNSLGY